MKFHLIALGWLRTAAS